MEKKSLLIYNNVLKNIIYPVLGKKTTWGRDLTKMGHKLFQRNYVGTFPSDKIPDIGKNNDGSDVTDSTVKKNSKLYCILNLDNSSQPGSHWIAIGYDIPKDAAEGKILVYDSFGRNTEDIIPSLVQKFGNKLEIVDQDSEQDVNMDDCGPRCLSFLYVLDRIGSKYAKLI